MLSVLVPYRQSDKFVTVNLTEVEITFHTTSTQGEKNSNNTM